MFFKFKGLDYDKDANCIVEGMSIYVNMTKVTSIVLIRDTNFPDARCLYLTDGTTRAVVLTTKQADELAHTDFSK